MNNSMLDEPKLTEFPSRTTDTIRYADTDRQGHVNNAVFATFLETGRVYILRNPAAPSLRPGTTFVIARLALDFRREIAWPGTVSIGTRVTSIGRGSISFEQALFQGDRCVATAETVIVLMDETTRKSTPLLQSTKQFLQLFVAVAR